MVNNLTSRVNIIILCICLVFQIAFSHIANAQIKGSSQTEFVSTEIDGYITLKIWNTKKGINYKFEQARKDAIKALLISGIAGSKEEITQPPMLRDADELIKFKAIEKAFFAKNGQWEKFTRSSTVESSSTQTFTSKKIKIYQVSVSRRELRRYLEGLNIIKSLNNGF